MATAVSVRPPSTSNKMGRPIPPPLHTTTVNGDSSHPTSSPSLANRATPSIATFPTGSAVNGDNNNSSTPRARLKRPSQAKSKVSTDDSPRPPKRKLVEPYVRTTEYILHKFRDRSPSLILHLHPGYFRFDQQDGSFRYDSPMKLILEHIRAQTIPHDILEELFQGNTPFYDGCLIVEIHDHKTSPLKSSTSHSDSNDENSIPFSVHNYNEHITPSPYVPYPFKYKDSLSKVNGQKALEGNKDDVKGSMAAPDRPLKEGQANAKRSKTFTTVLFPTSLSRNREIAILATTSAPDSRSGNRKSSAKETATPASAIPSTPLSSVPPTPSVSSRGAAKRQRMILEENDIHTFEAEVLRCTEAPLFLEPAQNFEESQAIMKMLTDPLHNHVPTISKGRKRTTAQLAADEALAAEEERVALIMDERLEPSLGTGLGTDGPNKTKNFEPNFGTFKALEEIRRHHEELAKKRKEEEALANVAKRQQQQELEMMRRREAEARRQHSQEVQRTQAQAAQQAAQQRLLQQQRNQQMQVAAQAAQAQAQAQQMHQNAMSGAPQSSPAMSHHSPINTSPLVANSVQTQGQVGQMVPSTPGGHGSTNSPRPGSMHSRAGMGAPMARQVSQANSQQGQSRTGTPQMTNATPHTMNAVPNGRMTPQVSMSQGSPVSALQGTPMMPPATMGAPQHMNGQPMTPVQRNQLMANQQNANQNAQFMQQNIQQRAAMLAQSQKLTPALQQMSVAQRQAVIARQLQANGGNPSVLINQMARQGGMMSQEQQAMLQNMTPEQKQEFMRNKQAQQAHQAQEYARRMAMSTLAQGNHAQGQMNMPQGSAAGMPQNGMAMAQSFSQQQHAAQQVQNQQNNMPQQMRANNMTPQQQQQIQMQAQALANQKNQFFRQLSERNGGQLPPNAEHQFQQWRMKQRLQAAQMGQMNPGMQGMGGQQHPGMQGVPNPAQLQAYQAQQRAQMQAANIQNQQMKMMQAQQMRQGQQNMQQNMMNGASPQNRGGG